MMFEMPTDVRGRIAIKALPKEQTTAGEWYLAVPAYSAAPEVGLTMIGMLANKEAELDRMSRGVGLPTRTSFYRAGSDGPVDISISPYASIDARLLERLVTGPFRRSAFECYSEISGVLAAHLRKIIELPESDEIRVDVEIRKIFRSLAENIKFVQSGHRCESCMSRFSNVGAPL
jgi:hypothetical protein